MFTVYDVGDRVEHAHNWRQVGTVQDRLAPWACWLVLWEDGTSGWYWASKLRRSSHRWFR